MMILISRLILKSGTFSVGKEYPEAVAGALEINTKAQDFFNT